MSLSHHHVSFVVVATAVAVAIAAVNTEAPQLSSPQSSTLKDRHPSVIIVGVIVVVLVVVVVHPPCTANAIADVDNVAPLVRAAPGGSWLYPQQHQRQCTQGPPTDNNQLKVAVEEGAGLWQR